jgi:hypothetical protein
LGQPEEGPFRDGRQGAEDGRRAVVDVIFGADSADLGQPSKPKPLRCGQKLFWGITLGLGALAD